LPQPPWSEHAALGIDGEGHKHPLALIEGATENAAVVQALIDNLIERALDPNICRLFIIDGAKALSKVIRRTFGAHTPIQRCQIHKARNVIERLPKPLHASVCRALRQAWELDDADKAERLLRNLARRLDQEASAAMRFAPMPEGTWNSHQGKKFPRLKRATVRFGPLRRPRDRAHHSRGRYNRARTYWHARTLGIEPRKPVGPPRMRGLGQSWCRT